MEQALNDPDSLFYHYQKLIALRKEHSAISRGSFHPVAPEHHKVFACIREDGSESILVVNNFYGENTELRPGDTIDGYRPLISNYNLRPVEEDMVLRPYKSAVWIRMKKLIRKEAEQSASFFSPAPALCDCALRAKNSRETLKERSVTEPVTAP